MSCDETFNPVPGTGSVPGTGRVPLRAVPDEVPDDLGGTGTGVPGTALAEVPDDLAGTRVPGRALYVVASVVRRIKQLVAESRRKGGVAGAAHRYVRTSPESISRYRSYVGSENSRKWIPEGYEEHRLIKFLRGTQVTYHKTVGTAGVAFGDAVAKTFARGRRLAAVIACLALAAILIAAFA